MAYAENTPKWVEWQRDYRLGLILIRPPPEVARQIDPLRAEYDPRAFAICPTHISLTDPLSQEMTRDVHDEICQILRKIRPFRLHFDKPQASTEYAGVYYPISPQGPIDALKQALHASAAFSGGVHERRNIPAHMTIAEFLSIEDSLMLCDQLQGTAPSGSFICDRLSFVVPDERFCFQEVTTFLLGRTQEIEASRKDSQAPTIELLDHYSEEVASQIHEVLQCAYKVEAELVKVKEFPPLWRSAAQIRSATSSFLGRRIGSELAAVAEYSLSGSHLGIDSLAVHPRFFRRGLASEILRSLLDKSDWQTADVETAAENHPAIALYSRFGFSESKRWQTDEGIEKVQFSCRRNP